MKAYVAYFTKTFAALVLVCTSFFPCFLFQSEPFSNVITRFAEELEVPSDHKVLLSHKTTTIKPTDSPGCLGLTTADILGKTLMNTVEPPQGHGQPRTFFPLD